MLVILEKIATCAIPVTILLDHHAVNVHTELTKFLQIIQLAHRVVRAKVHIMMVVIQVQHV